MNSAAELTPRQAAAWSVQARGVNETIQKARHWMALFLDGERRSSAEVDHALLEAQEASAQLHRSLRAAAGIHAPASSVEPVPLALLSTEASRELLSALRHAVALAERVDAERGRALPAEIPLQPGESRGTDLAESLSLLVLRLSLEVEGAQGRD